MAYGQEDYYRPVEGLKKSELKTALHELIQPESVLDYGGKGEGYTWSGFVVTDRMPDGTVRDRYSNVVRGFNGLNAVEGMNIEHSFANSWWGHTVNNAYCDLFNLFPVTERPTEEKQQPDWSGHGNARFRQRGDPCREIRVLSCGFVDYGMGTGR